MLLDPAVRCIVVQFSFSNEAGVPEGFVKNTPEWRDYESPNVQEERMARASGTCIVQPTENCEIDNLPGQLLAAGYTLTEAFVQPRRNDGPGGKNFFYAVRFVFVRNEYLVEGAGDTVKVKLACFQEICCDAFWRVRVFTNPYYQNGAEVPGQQAVSINLVVRIPRFRPDGSPVAERNKDAHGKKIGEPIPITPNFQLVIINDQLQLASA